MDQAAKLRELLAKQEDAVKEARIIAVSSGKGGVGKTNFTINIAIALAEMGKKVTIIDADLGLANVDVLLGVISKHNFMEVLSGEVEAKDLAAEGPKGIQIVSGGSGIAGLVDIDDLELERLILALSYFNATSDYIIIDTGAGISRSVMSFVAAASELVVVLNPDPTSITDAYALIKNVENAEEKTIRLVINRVESAIEGKEAFDKIQSTVSKFLGIDVENLGYIFEDHSLGRAVKKQMPVIVEYPRSISSKAIENIARKLDSGDNADEREKGFFGFLKRLTSLN